MREIKIHSSLSGQVDALKPRDPGKVGIYACGPTVYAPIHLGNARPYVIFMLLKRFLEHEGYQTNLVINITDINDKIYTAAREQGKDSQQLADEMAARYKEDTDSLGLGRPDAEPLATETMAEIIDLIAALIDKGHAYEADGDVYFRVKSYGGYGKLSNRKLEDMDSGEEPGSRKEDALDFALWKGHKEGEDSQWGSPWGPGRPGWHIECSAMAEELLGLDFDIHGGGSDLVFPHHENEIAQTEAGRGEPLARIWMHNGMVRFGEEKMAKSVGNIISLSDAIEQYGRDALMLFFLSGHYRQPIVFSEERMTEAAAQVRRIKEFVRSLPANDGDAENWGVEHSTGFFEALADDFNTPKALASLFELVSAANRRSSEGVEVAGVEAMTQEILTCLGLETLLEAGQAVTVSDDLTALMQAREAARAAKDFAEADRVRDLIEAEGYTVRDGASGPELLPKD